MTDNRTQELAAVFRPAMILMSGRFLGFILAFITPLVLVRVFTQEDFGTYKQLFLLVNTLLVLAQMGMAESLYYFLPRAQESSGNYVFNTLCVLVAVGLISVLGLWVFNNQIAALMNNAELAEYIPLAALVLFLLLIAVVLEIVMTNRKQHGLASATYALTDLMRSLCFIAPVMLFGSLRALMVGAVSFALCRFVAALYYLKGLFMRRSILRPGLLRSQLAYAIPFGLAGILEIIQVKYHLYVVSYYFDAATFALYAVGCLQIPIVDYMMTSTSYVMMINMREKAEQGKAREILMIWRDTSRKLAMILIPLIVGLLVIGRELIVFLFTSAYEESVPVFMIWTLGMSLTVLLTDGVLRVMAETRFLIIQNLLRLVLIMALINWFLAQFGLPGAVLVSVLANAVARYVALARLKALLKVSWSALYPWSSLALIGLLTLIAAVPAVLLKPAIQTGTASVIFIAGLVYVLIYYYLLRSFGPMAREEKAQLKQWAEMPVSQLLRRPLTKARSNHMTGQLAVEGLAGSGRE